MKQIKKHGSMSSYIKGCRCAECSRENTLRKWVDYNIYTWVDPLLPYGAESLMGDLQEREGCVEITSELVYSAFKKFEGKIKREALTMARRLGTQERGTK